MAKIGINIATGSLQKEEMIVGIDLGTTNSLVAIIHPETRKPVALKEHDGISLVPSIIYFSPDGQIKVGEAALPFLLSDPKRTIFSAKRLMGKRYDDLHQHAAFYTYKVIDNDSDGMVKVQVDDQFYSPVELSSLILKELKLRAEHILKTNVSKAVITVPAYFNDAQRQATRDAGKLAGLDVLRIINEPTAASLAYGLDQQGGQSEPLVAVYDLGGGTFDISILRMSDGVFEVLSTNGDTYLGGDDIDRSLLNYWAKQLGWDVADHTADPERWQQLRLKAELAKKQLSASSIWEDKIGELVLSLTRENLEALTRPLLEKTLVSCAAALKDAGIKKSDLQSVVMVGGSTRMPMIRQAVSEFFGLEVNTSVHPDEVEYINAHGTSTQANDVNETAAIKTLFGAHAAQLNVSSTKSMTGHLLGAAGGVEAVFAVKTVQTGLIPPTINQESPDPACDLNYTPNKAVERPVRVAMSNSFGFGGTNASLVFRKL